MTTPTVRLVSADWYRHNGRFNSPAVLALDFNQRVRRATPRYRFRASTRRRCGSARKPVRPWPLRAVSQAYSLKVLAEFGREPETETGQLAALAERLPVVALSHLADALAAMNDRGAAYQDVVRRITNRLRLDADRAHVEEIDDAALAWVWNTNVTATAVALDGLSRRKDNTTVVAPMVRWLIASRRDGRWSTTHENALALEAMVTYYRAFENVAPQMTAVVQVGPDKVGTASFSGRSTAARQVHVAMPGRHEFSYLLRATTAGTFSAAGARVEAMYAPEVTGRSEAVTVTVTVK